MHFNNQVLKVGTFDGILFSFFFDSIFFVAVAFCSELSVLCRRQPPIIIFFRKNKKLALVLQRSKQTRSNNKQAQ